MGGYERSLRASRGDDLQRRSMMHVAGIGSGEEHGRVA
jgi:hypothetical protein